MRWSPEPLCWSSSVVDDASPSHQVPEEPRVDRGDHRGPAIPKLRQSVAGHRRRVPPRQASLDQFLKKASPFGDLSTLQLRAPSGPIRFLPVVATIVSKKAWIVRVEDEPFAPDCSWRR